MKSLSFACAAIGGSLAIVSADPVPQPQAKMTPSALAGWWDMEWQSIVVRTYFIQASENLTTWDYIPVIELGDGQPLAWQFQSSAARQFFRLSYTDIPTTDPDLEDFDGDGVSSIVELKVLDSDPLSGAAWADTDHDGIADALEIRWYGNLTTMTATSDADGDGILDIFEAQAGADPTTDQTGSGATRSNFIYDIMGRLTGVTDGETRSYSFDSESNYQAIHE